MKFLSEELRYALNLPLPPVFSLRQDKQHLYKVPEFFGYESSSTRWILAMLTNKSNLKRLIKCGKTHEDLFSRYYQVPDRPVDLMPGDYSLETPAYHQQAVLYLTPLALALYMKQLYAVEMLLNLRDESGHKIVHPSEPCFVQKVFKKGAKRISNELSNTFPIIIAIRRNFFEGITVLLECGFTPQKQISIIYRMPFKESMNLYRDILDYMVELLRHRPCLNVTKFMKIMTDPLMGLTTFDIFVFDLEIDDYSKWDYVSIFRRVCRIGLTTRYFIEESAIQIINILEQIQVMGYFGGVGVLKTYYNGYPPESVDPGQVLSKKTIEELQSERISIMMDKIPIIIKATREDLFQLNPTELSIRLNFDYQVCLGSLFLWYQRCQFQDRCSHYMRLSRLMARIILDTRIIEDFFVKSDENLATVFSEWCSNVIKPLTISDFRIRMQDYILFTDHLCITFINRYDKIPNVLLKAPMLHGRDPAYSPIVRELLHFTRSSFSDMVNSNINSNQNNPLSNPIIFNVFDVNNHVSLKFIPANHAKHFSLDSYDENSCVQYGEHHANGFKQTNTSKLYPAPKKSKAHRPFSSNSKALSSCINSSNSLESLRSLSQHEERNSRLTPPGNCKTVAGIKSPNTDIYNSFLGLSKPKRKPSKSTTSTKSVKIPNKKPPSNHHFSRTKSSCDVDLKKAPKPEEVNPQKPLKLWKPNPAAINITDGELKSRLKLFLASNTKFRDLQLDNVTEKVPLKSLRNEIKKFKSAENIIKQIQSKVSTQLDCLSNNLIASSMIRIMQELSMVSSSKSNKAEFHQVFKSKI